MRSQVVTAVLFIATAASLALGDYRKSVPNNLKGGSSISDCSQSQPQFIPAIALVNSDNPLRFPLNTNTYYASLLWQRCANSPRQSMPIFAYPLSYQVASDRLFVTTPLEYLLLASREFPFLNAFKYSFFPYDFYVTTVGLDQFETSEISDMHLKVNWSGEKMAATFGRGLLFCYLRIQNPDSGFRFVFQGQITVWAQSKRYLGISVRTFRGAAVYHYYALYFPDGAQWLQQSSIDGNGAPQSNLLLSKIGFISFAALPSADSNLINDLENYAFAEVVGGEVGYNYEAENARVSVTFTARTVDVLSGVAQAPTLLALLPHHFSYLADGFSQLIIPNMAFKTSRGALRVIASNYFVAYFPYSGILPSFPNIYPDGQVVKETLDEMKQFVALGPTQYLISSDTYWTGKSLGKVAELVIVAESVGDLASRDSLLAALKSTLNDWFNPDDPFYFYFDSNVGALIGERSSYGSDTDLNDHHFHYGYFIRAAAILALYDPEWAQQNLQMVDDLIRDAANYDKTDKRFPMHRHFDHYVGHHYASGHAAFISGNNQESSSEAMNFNAALILWGEAIGDERVRDLGIYMYASETAAIQEYWFDIWGENYPADYPPPYSSLVWDDGMSYEIFWGPPTPEEIHGINILPISSTSLYLGRNPGLMDRFYKYMVAQIGGQERVWPDIIWCWQSLYDAKQAWSKFNSIPFTSEPGTTKIATRWMIWNMLNSGWSIDRMSANVSMFASFENGVRVAFSADQTPKTIAFKDGMLIEIDFKGFVVATLENEIVKLPIGISSGSSVSSLTMIRTTTSIASAISSVIATASASSASKAYTLPTTKTSTLSFKPSTSDSRSATNTRTTAPLITSTVLSSPSSAKPNSGTTISLISSTSLLPLPTLISSDGVCGIKADVVYTCPEGTCCSQYSYCGTSNEHCFGACQPEYGKCYISPTSTTLIDSSTGSDTRSTMMISSSLPTDTFSSLLAKTTSRTIPALQTIVTLSASFVSTQAESSVTSPTTTIVSLPTIVSLDGICGIQTGTVYICPEGTCCSQYSYCGTTNEHCFGACQPEYGKCGATIPTKLPSQTTPNAADTHTPTYTTQPTSLDSTAVAISTTTSQSIAESPSPTRTAAVEVISPDGTCGLKDNGLVYKCLPGYCCSKFNYCGSTVEHCFNGCQSSFGYCNASTDTTTLPTIVSQDGTCGRNYGVSVRLCPDGNCCSKFNFCGNTAVHCSEGCQPDYGVCNAPQPTATLNSPTAAVEIEISQDGTCGEKTSAATERRAIRKCPLGSCCSKFNFCGFTSLHCDAAGGCQSEYGRCN